MYTDHIQRFEHLFMFDNSRQEDFLHYYKKVCSLLSTSTVINKLCLFSDQKIDLPSHAKKTSIFLKLGRGGQ